MSNLILSTSNIMGKGPTVVRRPITQKSNLELLASLRANISSAQESALHRLQVDTDVSTSNDQTHKPDVNDWTKWTDDTLEVPLIDFADSGLAEERQSYEITVKLFFLPNAPASGRCDQVRQAVDLALKELHMPSIDLLIVSFPGISFDDEDSENTPQVSSRTNAGCADLEVSAEDIDTMMETWYCLEQLHDDGILKKLGVAEFGEDRLTKFLQKARIRPSVNQINVRDCCVVPRPLILFAKQEQIELFTHNDCTNILPRGTLRDLLGQGDRGAGVLADGPSSSAGLQGDVEPQWVMKYTAVVKDRGVVENKGYFAAARLKKDGQ